MRARSMAVGGRLAWALAVVLCGCLAFAGGASARASHVFSSAFGSAGAGTGQFSGPSAVAVDQITGDVYVVDTGNDRVEEFDASGVFIAAFGSSGSASGQFSAPNGIAVDNSGLLSGDVYVVDAGNNRVQRFSPTGTFVSSLNTTGGGTIAGIAVGTTGNAWMYADDGTVDEFDSAGTHLAAFNSNFGVTPGLAVDAAEDLYILRGSPLVEEISNAGLDIGTVDPCGCTTGVAVDQATGEVYSDQGSAVAVFDDLSGTATDAFGSGNVTQGAGVAINSASKTVYVADAGTNQVAIFTVATLPDVATGAASSLTTSAATVAGTVNPQTIATSYQFEYGTATSYGSVAPLSPGDAGSGASDVPVSTVLSSLLPNTTYHYRLNASNGSGTTHGADQTFTTTSPPLVDAESVGSVGAFDAVLQAQVNPEGFQTGYRFEYGATPAYGNTNPIPEGSVGSDSTDQRASTHISGLQAATIYHYRIVTTNSWGTTNGPDQTFRTFELPSGQLPDSRAYELVSPISKNGGDVIADNARTRASADGSAAAFTSLQGFADVRGTGVAIDYLSQRSINPNPGDNGWATHAITPPQEPLTLNGAFQGLDPLWVGEFSPDLTRGVFRAWSPLTNTPNVANVQNLYTRTDLRIPAAGSYQLATDCSACGSTPLPSNPRGKRGPFLAGASADFSHVLFESVLPLSADAPSQPLGCATDDNACNPQLYESVNGAVRFVGHLPDSACGTPPCVTTASQAGQGAFHGFYTPHVISADGSRIFFTDNSAGGGQFGNLYMRVDGASTVQLNASEKSVPDPSTQDAEFWTASTDGSRVFFTTSEQLTNDDTNSAADLYMYDVNAPAGSHLTRLSIDNEPADAANGVRGVIGASDDGHYVYFVSDGQLVAGKPLILSPAIYLWHDGTISYVGEMSESTDTSDDLPTSWDLNPLLARVSPDGRHLLFSSHSGVGLLSAHGGTDYNHGNTCGGGFTHASSPCQELYLYSSPSSVPGSDGLVCVSCNPSGAPGSENALFTVRSGEGAAVTTSHLPHPLADDGSRVFFSTRDALVAGDANGKVDVYEYDTATASLHLISSGKDPSDSYFMDASASGNDVFFATRQQLVGWDTDQNYDLYDARVGGGFPEPLPAVPTCLGDGCQGAPPVIPAAGVAGSSLFSGPGNVTSPKPKARAKRKPVRCKRGFVRRGVHGRVRCVKVKPKKHRHVAHRAKHAAKRRGAK